LGLAVSLFRFVRSTAPIVDSKKCLSPEQQLVMVELCQQLSILRKLSAPLLRPAELDHAFREAGFLSFGMQNFEIFDETCSVDELRCMDEIRTQIRLLQFCWPLGWRKQNHLRDDYKAYLKSLPIDPVVLDYMSRLVDDPREAMDYIVSQNRNKNIRLRSLALVKRRELRGIYQRDCPTALWQFMEQAKKALIESEKEIHGTENVESLKFSIQSIKKVQNNLQDVLRDRMSSVANGIDAVFVQSKFPIFFIFALKNGFILLFYMNKVKLTVPGERWNSAQFRLVLTKMAHVKDILNEVCKEEDMIPIHYHLFVAGFDYGSFTSISEFVVILKAHLFVVLRNIEQIIAIISNEV
jgi:hypothetical protein